MNQVAKLASQKQKPFSGNGHSPGDVDFIVSEVELTYISDEQPGFTRRRSGKGFSFLDTERNLIRDKETLARLKALVIPPAWTDVWISPDASGHIQATGRDARGRKQYIYHPRWELVRNYNKYSRLIDFAEALPRIREQVAADVRTRTLHLRHVAAVAIQVLDQTWIRIGNKEYMRQNRSFGLTTLQDRHVRINGKELNFRFKGKSGKMHEITVVSRQLARLVKQCQDLPGQVLFQYIDGEGNRRHLRSQDINNYLREISGEPFSAKDFRTWGGTTLVASALVECGEGSSERERKANITAAIRHAAGCLGNTCTVCRQYYVHPAILDAYEDGELIQHYQSVLETESTPYALNTIEAAVLTLLKRNNLPFNA